METKEGQKKQQPLPTEKQHLAICCSVIDMGTQTGKYGDARKMWINWEIPGEKAVFSEEKGPQAFVVGAEYTFSLDKKANLRKMLDSWMGSPVIELDSARIVKLLKRPAMVQVTHVSNDEGLIRARVANSGTGVFKIPAGTPFPKETENKPFFFDLDSYSAEAFALVPKWLQEKIQKSPEYRKAIGGGSAAITGTPSQQDLMADQDDF